MFVLAGEADLAGMGAKEGGDYINSKLYLEIGMRNLTGEIMWFLYRKENCLDHRETGLDPEKVWTRWGGGGNVFRVPRFC